MAMSSLAQASEINGCTISAPLQRIVVAAGSYTREKVLDDACCSFH